MTPDQIEEEFAGVVKLIFDTYKDFGITDYRCVLSLRDPEDKVKYHDDDEMWNKAENALRKVLDDIGIDYTEEIGEAAFYGPKLDVNVKPAIGNEYTLSTCQLDFCLPEKFNLTYIDKDGTKKTPVVLHRAILGSLDRFMAYILEETKGNLPLWLAPVQARIIPVKNEDEELNAYSHELLSYLDENGIRVEIDERAEKLGYRVRAAQVEKVPYLIILGKNEVKDGTVEIKAIAREAGSRTKIAVWSNDPDVDPVGACVGMNGARVNAIVNELRGEKIDIITWNENPAMLIENALSPAKVISVIADAEEKAAKVVVPDYQLSLAIGKEGQNARLAARLTGFKIDIKSETQAREAGDFFDYENEYEDDEYYEEDGGYNDADYQDDTEYSEEN